MSRVPWLKVIVFVVAMVIVISKLLPPEEVSFKAYTGKDEESVWCEAKVRGLITIGTEEERKGSYRNIKAYYCLAILENGDYGVVKVEAIEHATMVLNGLVVDSLKEVPHETTVVRGKTKAMPYLQTDILESLRGENSTNNQVDINEVVKSLTLLDLSVTPEAAHEKNETFYCALIMAIVLGVNLAFNGITYLRKRQKEDTEYEYCFE